MTWGKVEPPDALVALSEVVSEADGPLPPARVLPLLRDLADEIGDGPADALGFGTVAYHALTGMDPFADGPDRARPVTEALPGFPEAAASSLMQALSSDRSSRPAPSAVLAALDAAWPAYDEPAADQPADEPAPEPVETDPPVDEPEEPAVPEIEPDSGPGAEPGPRPQTKAEFNQAMRELVAPPRPVPELGTLDNEGTLPEAVFDPERPNRERRRRRSSGRRRRPSSDR
jgi:hypothetical protein